tara:strand:+ start:154 stop:1329 length:1176 start_codon:yes stop_codon:yes gene_type:complete
MESKKVLILAHKPPYPKVDGGCIAIAQILEAFIDLDVSVSFLCFETQKHPSEKLQKQPKFTYKSISINTEVGPWSAFKNLGKKASYFLDRFKHTAFENELINALQKNNFDLIVFESLFTSNYLETVQKHSSAKIVYRSHNIEHQIWETQLVEEQNLLRKVYLKLQVKRLKNEEIKFWNKVDAISSISEKDSEFIKQHSLKKVDTVGLYCNENHLLQKDRDNKVDFFHIGAMDWLPNQFGLNWLLDNVWELFRTNNPTAELHLAGKGMSEKLINTKAEGVNNHGEVADASAFMKAHKIMLVPLFSGSGIRVKIIEGMAQGKCIITTSLGAEGLSIKNKENILIANSKEEFIAQMQFCSNQPIRVSEIGTEARKFAKENFSKQAVSLQLKNLF